MSENLTFEHYIQ